MPTKFNNKVQTRLPNGSIQISSFLENSTGLTSSPNIRIGFGSRVFRTILLCNQSVPLALSSPFRCQQSRIGSEKSGNSAQSGYNKGTIRGDKRYLVVSKDVRRHRLISISYINQQRCHRIILSSTPHELGNRIAKRRIPCKPLLVHASQHRHHHIRVVVDVDFALVFVQAMQAAHILL